MCAPWDWCGSRARVRFHTLKRPRQSIVLAVHQDRSGTTDACTKHMSAINEEWRDRGPGVGRLLQWPTTAMAVRIQSGERHER